jgi:hypothetical protein
MQPSIASLFPKAAGPAPAPTPPAPAPAEPAEPSAPPAPVKKSAAPRPSKPGKYLPGARLQPVGAAKLEKKIEALRLKQPDARIVVLSLCWRLRCCSADEYRVMNESNHTAFDTFRRQTVVGHSEFFGMVGEGGVATAIAEALSEDERTHVLVVDATPRGEFARLAACFGAVWLKLTTGRVIKVAHPANALFAGAVAEAQRCATLAELREVMEAHFDANLAYEVEPVLEEEDGGEVPRKKAKKGI